MNISQSWRGAQKVSPQRPLWLQNGMIVMAAWRWALVTVLLLGLAKEAWVSQIHFQDATPVQVASRASFILHAIYRKDAEEDKPSGGMLFEVTSIGRAPDGHALKGKHLEIRVWQASAEAWGRVRQIAETTGVRESPIIDRMVGAPELVSGKPYILFLHQGAEKLEFVFEAQDAYLTPEAFHSFRPR